MSALTLLLVAALCTDGPKEPCSYMDVTQRLKVTTDAGCYEKALEANGHNVSTSQRPRYNCVTPAEYLVLIGEGPAPVKAKGGNVL